MNRANIREDRAQW